MKPQDFTRFTRDEDSKWVYKNLTGKIIGAAMEARGILGSGFLEYGAVA